VQDGVAFHPPVAADDVGRDVVAGMAYAETRAGGVWEEVEAVERGAVGVDVGRGDVLTGLAPSLSPRRFDRVGVIGVVQTCVSPKGCSFRVCALKREKPPLWEASGDRRNQLAYGLQHPPTSPRDEEKARKRVEKQMRRVTARHVASSCENGPETVTRHGSARRTNPQRSRTHPSGTQHAKRDRLPGVLHPGDHAHG